MSKFLARFTGCDSSSFAILICSVLFGSALLGCGGGSGSVGNTSGNTGGNGGGTGTTPPSITAQPVSVAVSLGESAMFAVGASGSAPLSYQWQKNGTNIAGANSASFSTPATGILDGGEKFSVVVSNAAGQAASNAATLTVNPLPAVDVTTYHNDNGRIGLNASEVVLTRSNVKAASFGRVGFFATDGLVDAQPLYLSSVAIPGKGTHDVLYAVSERDSVYAFDATTGDILWRVSVLPPGENPSDDRGCGQVTPSIGITSTPVIDRSRGPNGVLYLVAMSRVGTSGTYLQRLHALDLTTGAELFGGPTAIAPTYSGSGTTVAFDPAQYKERAALLLLNGKVYLSWASHCDDQPYTGWVMAYDANTLQLASVLNLTPNGSEGAIWMSGAGPAADSSGNIYLLDANGTFDTTLDGNGFPSQGDFGNTFLELATSSGLAVADYFEEPSQGYENSNDVDLGSGGALLLPDLVDGSGATRHLAVGAGKDGNIYVVNRDAMGEYTGAIGGAYQELDNLFTNDGIFSMPAYFNGTVYFGPVGQPLMAFAIVNALLPALPTAQTAGGFAYPGATPSISANGTSDGIVWAVENGATGVLHAFNASDLSELYNSNQAGARDQFADNKFITPTIANGKVYVGTPTGVAVFGLLP